MTGQANVTGQEFVLLGTITRPHGIKGELKVRPFTAELESIVRYTQLLLAIDEQAEKKAYTNEQARVSGTQVIVRLRECSSRDMAESLVGQGVWVRSTDLPPAAADELYLHTLLGKAVQTVDGQPLGVAEQFLAGSSQDILVVRQGKQEHLIPAVRAFICAVDNETVTLDLPEGLLDINR